MDALKSAADVQEPHGIYRTSSDIIEVAGQWRHLLQFEDAVDGSSLSEEHFKVAIAYAHEHQHRVDFMTTPFGLLLWRIDVSITTDARYLARAFGYPGGISLVDHCRRHDVGIPVGPEAIRSLSYDYGVANDLEALVSFRRKLWAGCSENVAVSSLLEEANRVLAILRARFDIRTQWQFTSFLPSATPAIVSVSGRRSLGAVDILERSAALWERVVVWLSERRNPSIVQWWIDFRNTLLRYRDVGGLVEVNTAFGGYKRLCVSALSGPCDPALDLSEDVPIELAFPQWRWALGLSKFEDTLDREGDPVPAPDGLGSVDVYNALAQATLNGPRGLFADAMARGQGDRATDPRRSYHAFVLRRFTNEFTRRALRESGETADSRQVRIDSLVTLFEDFCKISQTELDGVRLSKDDTGALLVQIFFEFAEQEAAKHAVLGIPPEIIVFYQRLKRLAQRLTRDFDVESYIPGALVRDSEDLVRYAFARLKEFSLIDPTWYQ